MIIIYVSLVRRRHVDTVKDLKERDWEGSRIEVQKINVVVKIKFIPNIF